MIYENFQVESKESGLTVAEQVSGRNRGVRDGVEIFVPDGGEVLQVNAAVEGSRTSLPAIDSHLMAALHQARGEFFRKGFESAVACGNSARPE